MIHYDWGLRAVKSVLRQACGLKRAAPDVLEDMILMRALRDFNWPKIVVEDRPIFRDLIGDLFPGIQADTQVDLELQARIRDATKN
jgi:dynein heavy chain